LIELKKIKLEKLDPNPFRDGSGGTPPASWESVAESYGFDEKKLEELVQSYETNGVWAGVHCRAVGPKYQLAFGHHRVEAARRLRLDTLPVIVADLSDDEMVKMMAAENSEEYGHDFALGVLNAVEAVVRAYAAGKIALTQPERVRYLADRRNNTHPYTVETLSEFLGWALPTGAPPPKLFTAVSALELIEQGALKRAQLKGLGSTQVRELVSFTKRKIEAEREKLETQKNFLEKARAAAAKEDDKRKVASLTKKVEELRDEESQVVRTTGAAAAATVANYFKETKSMVEAARKAADEAGLVKPLVKSSKTKTNNLSNIDPFRARLDSALLEEDNGWKRILLLASELGERKTFRQLEESLLALAERARARAKELKKAQETR
jgi:ParB-like chromosome segregation protein Spo0J